MKSLLFAQPHVAPNPYDFLSSLMQMYKSHLGLKRHNSKETMS